MIKNPIAYSYIRMSSEVQLAGDSLRRQLELSKAYAEKSGWELLEENQLRDIGLSAFSGANVSGGALGQFLEAIRAGKIQQGSVLIIESLDRLSRQEPWKSLGLFSEIINAGVVIVTLTDGRTYTAETGLGDLIFSIVDMSRAHEESRTKSHRLSAAWANKRKNTDERKLTAQCPSWLRLSEDKKFFRVLPDRAKVITQIFEDSAAGIGNYSITRRLNGAGVPPFGRSNGWCTSFVAKILSNRAVLGEFQPHRLLNRKRVTEGEPIKNYFPAIISEELFYRAQDARSQRRVRGAGRKGTNISNLFSGLAKCAYCNSSMRFENKGAGPKGGTYLVCEKAKRGLGCEKKAWRYDHLEASFLAFVKELDLESLVRSDADTKRRVDLDNDISALRGRLTALEQQRNRTFDLFAKSELATDFVAQKLDELEQERTQLTKAVAEKERERDEFGSELSGFYEGKEQIKLLLERLQRTTGSEVYRLRAQIASRLKALVSNIFVAPVGCAPSTRKAISMLKEQEFPDRDSVVEHLTHRLQDERENRRYFLIGFGDGTVRGVYPMPDDPLEFEEQVVASADDGMSRITGGDVRILFPSRVGAK